MAASGESATAKMDPRNCRECQESLPKGWKKPCQLGQHHMEKFFKDAREEFSAEERRQYRTVMTWPCDDCGHKFSQHFDPAFLPAAQGAPPIASTMERILPLLEQNLAISTARQNAVFQCACDSTARGSAKQIEFKRALIEHYRPQVEGVRKGPDGGPVYRRVQCLVTEVLLRSDQCIAGHLLPKSGKLYLTEFGLEVHEVGNWRNGLLWAQGIENVWHPSNDPPSQVCILENFLDKSFIFFVLDPSLMSKTIEGTSLTFRDVHQKRILHDRPKPWRRIVWTHARNAIAEARRRNYISEDEVSKLDLMQANSLAMDLRGKGWNSDEVEQHVHEEVKAAAAAAAAPPLQEMPWQEIAEVQQPQEEENMAARQNSRNRRHRRTRAEGTATIAAAARAAQVEEMVAEQPVEVAARRTRRAPWWARRAQRARARAEQTTTTATATPPEPMMPSSPRSRPTRSRTSF